MFTSVFPADNIFALDPTLLTGRPTVSGGYLIQELEQRPRTGTFHRLDAPPFTFDSERYWTRYCQRLSASESGNDPVR